MSDSLSNALNETTERQAGHTPGPWMFRDSNDPAARMVFDADGKSGVAKVITHIHEYGKEYPEEMRANGHLIAAAPELRDAALECVEFFDALAIDLADRGIALPELKECSKYRAIGTRLIAAIAKAEGRA